MTVDSQSCSLSKHLFQSLVYIKNALRFVDFLVWSNLSSQPFFNWLFPEFCECTVSFQFRSVSNKVLLWLLALWSSSCSHILPAFISGWVKNHNWQHLFTPNRWLSCLPLFFFLFFDCREEEEEDCWYVWERLERRGRREGGRGRLSGWISALCLLQWILGYKRWQILGRAGAMRWGKGSWIVLPVLSLSLPHTQTHTYEGMEKWTSRRTLAIFTPLNIEQKDRREVRVTQ